jgi:peptide/nickel transport system substrate-binding protein
MNAWRKLGTVLAAGLLAAACGNGSNSSNGPPPHNNVLVYAAPGEPDTLDPGYGISGFDQYYEKAIYDTLIVSDPKTMNPTIPGLATSWQFMGANKLTFRLNLRHNVQFQDGTPFNAEAVKANIDHYKAGGLWFDMAPVTSETVVDENTIDLNLASPYSPLPAILSFRAGMMASPTALQKEGKDYGRNPVGTGPFTFKSWTSGSEIVTTRFENYWNRKSIHLNGIDYKVIPTTQAMSSAVQTGQVDFGQLLNLPATSIKSLQGRSSVVAKVLSTLSPGIVTTNNTVAPFDNPTVRKAAELSINRPELAKAMVGGYGQGQAWQYVPPNYWASTKDLKPYKYDPSQAKQLLAQAGYPNGITVQICTFSNDTVQAATIEKQQMAPAGINLQINQEPVNSCVAKLRNGGVPMVQIGWFFLASPYQGYATMFGARGPTPQYPGVDALLAKIASVYTQAEQKPLYDQMNRLLFDTAPSIPTYWLVNSVGYSSRLRNIVFDINGQEHLDQAYFA